MASTSSSANSGMSLLGTIGVIFIVLKLLHIQPVAHWSWWWVLSPFWIGLVLGLVIVGVIFLAIVVDLKARKKAGRR